MCGSSLHRFTISTGSGVSPSTICFPAKKATNNFTAFTFWHEKIFGSKDTRGFVDETSLHLGRKKITLSIGSSLSLRDFTADITGKQTLNVLNEWLHTV